MGYLKPKYRAIPDKGFHEVVGHGSLSRGQGYGFKIEVRMLERSANWSDPSLPSSYYPPKAEPSLHVVGVGDLVALPIGRIFSNGKPFADIVDDGTLRRRSQREVEIINPEISTVRGQHLLEDISMSSYHGPWALRGWNPACLKVRDSQTGRTVYIPYTELARVLFGPSSDFLIAAFHGHLAKHSCHRFAHFDRRPFSIPGVAEDEIAVRAYRKLKGSEAITAGQILTEDWFWVACRSLWGSLQVEDIAKNKVQPRIDLPIAKISRLTVLVDEVTINPREEAKKSGAKPLQRFFGFRILDLELQRRFKRVIVAYPVFEKEPAKPGEKNMVVDDPSKDSQVTTDEPSVAAGGGTDMPVLGPGSWGGKQRSIAIDFIGYAAEETKRSVLYSGKSEDKTIVATGLPNYVQSGIRLVNMYDDMDRSEPIYDPDQNVAPARLITAATAILRVANRYSMRATEITARGETPLTAMPRCLFFPPRHDYRELKWSYVDIDRDIRRRALAVRLSNQAQTLLLIEAELEDTDESIESAPLLVLQPTSQYAFALPYILDLLARVAKRHGTWDVSGKLELLRHYGKKSSVEGMCDGLEEILHKIKVRP